MAESFSLWLFWARSSGLILSYFIVLFPALTIARLCQKDFQDVRFVSERVVCRVKASSRKAWHSGAARARLGIVRVALEQGPAVTRSGGGGSCMATLLSAIQCLEAASYGDGSCYWGLPLVGLPNCSLSSGFLQVLVPSMTTAPS